MNLATARSANRAREIGVKKVLGASKSKIFNQFMGESFMMGLIAMMIALFLVFLILPYFNTFTGKTLALNVIENTRLLLLLIIIWIVVSFLSGSYPSIYLSRFNPLRVLYSNTVASSKSKTTLNFRRVLVIFQFMISILLIVGAMTVYKQLQFIQDKGLGFDKEQLIVIPMAGRMDPDKVKTFKNELLLDPEVISTSSSNAVPGMRIHVLGIKFPDLAEDNLEQNEEGDDFVSIRVLSTDVDVVKTYGLKMADGRAFSRDFPNDPDNAFIINEAAVRAFELENPVGERLAYNYAMEEDKVGHIVGVVKDFHYASLHTEVEPLMIHIYPRFDRYFSIRVQSTNIQNTLDKLSEKWPADFPAVPFDHFSLDTY